MKFWLAVCALVLLLPGIAVTTWHVSCEPYESTADYHATADDPVSLPFSEHQGNPATNNQSSAIKDPPRWCAAVERPDWWVVIVAFLTGLAIAYQAQEMAKTTSLVREQAGWMKRQADLMNRQAILIRGQLNEMRSSGEQMKEMIKHAGDQAEAISRQADLMERQAVIMERQITVPHRAYLEIGEPTGELIHWTFPVRNVGQVPARIMRVSMGLQIDELVPGKGFIDNLYVNSQDKDSNAIIPAHSTHPAFGIVVNFPSLPNLAQNAMVTGAVHYEVGFTDPITGLAQTDTVYILRVFRGETRDWKSGYTFEEFNFE